MEATKQCSGCKQWKQRSEFYKDLARRDGLTCYCKECDNAKRCARRHEVASDRATAKALAQHRAAAAQPGALARTEQAAVLAEKLRAALGGE